MASAAARARAMPGQRLAEQVVEPVEERLAGQPPARASRPAATSASVISGPLAPRSRVRSRSKKAAALPMSRRYRLATVPGRVEGAGGGSRPLREGGNSAGGTEFVAVLTLIVA